jgi:hypothetical protein
MKWPAATSDYMAWVTSSLAIELDNDVEKLVKGGTLVGDCAYMKKLYMATPLKGFLGGHKDAYNWMQLQQTPKSKMIHVCYEAKNKIFIS